MTVKIEVFIPEDNYDILKKYGYDFEKNAQCQANEVAETLKWCSENPDVDSELIED